MNITISPMLKSDFTVLKKFIFEAYGQELGEPWTLESSLAHCQEAFETGFTYTARKGNTIVGGVFANPAVYEKGTELFIDSFVVGSNYRGQGIGQQMLDFMTNLAKKKKFVGVRLLSNPKLKSFAWYHTQGFKESGWVELVKFF